MLGKKNREITTTGLSLKLMEERSKLKNPVPATQRIDRIQGSDGLWRTYLTTTTAEKNKNGKIELKIKRIQVCGNCQNTIDSTIHMWNCTNRASI